MFFTSLIKKSFSIRESRFDDICNNFNKLISLLYRLDINESKLKQLLADSPGEDAGMIIAELIIERQLQKIKSRNENNSNNIIPEDDKW